MTDSRGLLALEPGGSCVRAGLLLLGIALGFAAAARALGGQDSAAPPNIVYILADDLGYRELGCYGQKKIRTPHLDRLAASGIRFTQHYSGSPVCAPSRCTLLTGLHTGHCTIRNNDEMAERGDVWHDPALEGQRPLPAGTRTVAAMLREAGYRTACIGKWGLGPPGSTGDPNRMGFDLWFGYNCQRQAHNYYPQHLWRNDRKVALDNPAFAAHQRFPAGADPEDPAAYARYRGKTYSVDLMTREALAFITRNRQRRFFLYLAYPIPHVALQVPDDSLKEYAGAFPETPYLGNKGYLPHPTPRAAYAAMISRMDRDIGRVLERLEREGLRERTLVLFSSDNGATYAGGADAEFFESVGELRGLKGSLFEGGIRVPFLASWPGTIRGGRVSDRVSAFWDMMPTLAELAGAEPNEETDGISLVPTLLERTEPRRHDHLYWEHGNQQAVRLGDWKAVRTNIRKRPGAPIRLFDLEHDRGEKRNVAADHPEIVARVVEIMNSRSPAALAKWNFPPVPPAEKAGKPRR